eukprot:contig_17702_g4344
MPIDVDYDKVISTQAAFVWLAHSRPDLGTTINRAAQVSAKTFAERHVQELNKAIKYAKSTADLVLSYYPLDKNTLHLRVKKSRRGVRSIMAGEVYAFAIAFDKVFVIKHDLERLYKQPVPLTMLTDSRQLFDVITRASHTTEKRLMIDIAAAREAYNRNEISNVSLVKSASDLADGRTKPRFSQCVDDVLWTAMDRNPVELWIIRQPSVAEVQRSDKEKVGV